MPLHKSSRGPRLDPTMISAPLGDFRHTMHIGRGGDAFGDTSFLATHGPSSASSDPTAEGATTDSETPLDHNDNTADVQDGLWNNELQHSGSVSSFTYDLDLDLGPSILGDVLGVMDGLGLDSEWTGTNDEEEVFSPTKTVPMVEVEPVKTVAEEESVSVKNELNEKTQVGMDGDDEEGERRVTEGNGIKPKGLRPKVRFSDKREEIIRQASEEEGPGLEVEGEDGPECVSPTLGESHERGNNTVSGRETEPPTPNHKADSPPSPASSHSSEYEGITPLDRRTVDNCHSETDSDEEDEGGDSGRGYTFEDEFDDEIGL